ncbi:toll-like receptor 6 [Littorina saxatilis]|uniref:toll-like receptor 6 n=1 Tax=Littorina saxatilis TaxID=31220 RepID=UPI0038B669B0
MLNLGNNPFQCNCDILWFKKWLESRPHIFNYGDPYVCANLHHVTLQDFVLNEQACLLGSDAASFTIAVTCVLLSFLLLFVIVFRFRWRMRLWLYEACRASRQDRRRQLLAEGRRYRYDVFVAYAAEDLAWVQRELLPVLEGEWGLRLCVHQRDFEAGKHIVDNISDCVSDSERVVLVFSPHFAHSEWCQFELKYCQVNVMERDDVMVLVELRETPSRDMTGAMLAVLQTTTYIEWEDEQDARQSFWARLRLEDQINKLDKKNHLKRLGISDTAKCECGSEEGTPKHVLQTCHHLETARQHYWPEDTSLGTKLWGPAADLQKTADFMAATDLKI